jgi:hypothetical protein
MGRKLDEDLAYFLAAAAAGLHAAVLACQTAAASGSTVPQAPCGERDGEVGGERARPAL